MKSLAGPADERFVLHPPDVLPVGTSFTAWVNITDTNNGYAWTSATLSLSWSGSGTSYTTSPGTTHDIYSGDFEGTATPGNYTVWFTADYSAVTSPPDTNLVSQSAALSVVAVTNVTASASHIAVGTNRVTLTAQMNPIPAGQFVTWAITNGGGSLSTNQGLTTELICDTPGEIAVTATCGTSSATTIVRVYAVTGVSASPSLVAAGDTVTLTATTEPANCPLPLTWNVSTNTGLSITTNFAVGTHPVTVSLGSSTQTVSLVSVGVKAILYEVTPDSGNWLPWADPFASGTNPASPTTLLFPIGESFRVKAVPEPEGAEFPAGWPVWTNAASGVGQIATATFGTVSTNEGDIKILTATCGTSSRSEQALVFRLDGILVATNHVAIGTSTNTLSLTPLMTPSGVSGMELLVDWVCTNAVLDLGPGDSILLPCNQSGIFTITATCGTSSASTNIYVYAVTGISVAQNPVAVGDDTLLTAITEPPLCPLPITWVEVPGAALPATGLQLLAHSSQPGQCETLALLGTSGAATNLWFVGVKELKYKFAQGGWEDAGGSNYELQGTTLMFLALIDPPDAPGWPAGWPTWHGTGATVNGLGPVGWATFGSVSSTLGDLKTVKAKCGTSEKTASVTVFNMTLSNVPAEDWAGRSYSRFGLGEVVTVSNSVTPLGLTAITAGVQMWPKTHAGALYVLQPDQMKATFSFAVQDQETETCYLSKRGTSFASNTVTFIKPEQIWATPLTDPSTLLPGEQAEYDAAVAVPPPPLLGPLVPPSPIRVSGAYRLTVSPNDVSFTKLTYHHPETQFFPQLLPPGPGVDAGSTLAKWDSGIQLPTPGNNAKIGIVNFVYEPKLAEGTVLPNAGSSAASVRPFYEIQNQSGAFEPIDGNAVITISGSFKFDWSAQMEALGKTWTRTYGPPPP